MKLLGALTFLLGQPYSDSPENTATGEANPLTSTCQHFRAATQQHLVLHSRINPVRGCYSTAPPVWLLLQCSLSRPRGLGVHEEEVEKGHLDYLGLGERQIVSAATYFRGSLLGSVAEHWPHAPRPRGLGAWSWQDSSVQAVLCGRGRAPGGQLGAHASGGLTREAILELCGN